MLKEINSSKIISKLTSELTITGSPNKSMISNFNTLENRKVTIGSGGLLCFYPNIISLDEKHKSYPISVIF